MTLGNDVSLREELNRLTPRLRRYARALTTGHPANAEIADDIVHVTLMRALGARNVGAPTDLVIRLYATVTQLNREVAISGRQAQAAGARRPTLVSMGGSSVGANSMGGNFSAVRRTKLSAGLLALPLETREALLLVGLEGFGYAEASRILRISRSVLMARLTQARSALDTTMSATPSQKPARSRAHLRLVT